MDVKTLAPARAVVLIVHATSVWAEVRMVAAWGASPRAVAAARAPRWMTRTAVAQAETTAHTTAVHTQVPAWRRRSASRRRVMSRPSRW